MLGCKWLEEAGGAAGARSCMILGAKPGSLNLILRTTGSQGDFQAEEGGGQNCFKQLILVAQ